MDKEAGNEGPDRQNDEKKSEWFKSKWLELHGVCSMVKCGGPKRTVSCINEVINLGAAQLKFHEKNRSSSPKRTNAMWCDGWPSTGGSRDVKSENKAGA